MAATDRISQLKLIVVAMFDQIALSQYVVWVLEIATTDRISQLKLFVVVMFGQIALSQ